MSHPEEPAPSSLSSTSSGTCDASHICVSLNEGVPSIVSEPTGTLYTPINPGQLSIQFSVTKSKVVFGYLPITRHTTCGVLNDVTEEAASALSSDPHRRSILEAYQGWLSVKARANARVLPSEEPDSNSLSYTDLQLKPGGKPLTVNLSDEDVDLPVFVLPVPAPCLLADALDVPAHIVIPWPCIQCAGEGEGSFLFDHSNLAIQSIEEQQLVNDCHAYIKGMNRDPTMILGLNPTTKKLQDILRATGKQGEVVYVLGRTGDGKTHSVLALARSVRVVLPVLHEPANSFTGLPSSLDRFFDRMDFDTVFFLSSNDELINHLACAFFAELTKAGAWSGLRQIRGIPDTPASSIADTIESSATHHSPMLTNKQSVLYLDEAFSAGGNEAKSIGRFCILRAAGLLLASHLWSQFNHTLLIVVSDTVHDITRVLPGGSGSSFKGPSYMEDIALPRVRILPVETVQVRPELAVSVLKRVSSLPALEGLDDSALFRLASLLSGMPLYLSGFIYSAKQDSPLIECLQKVLKLALLRTGATNIKKDKDKLKCESVERALWPLLGGASGFHILASGRDDFLSRGTGILRVREDISFELDKDTTSSSPYFQKHLLKLLIDFPDSEHLSIIAGLISLGVHQSEDGQEQSLDGVINQLFASVSTRQLDLSKGYFEELYSLVHLLRSRAVVLVEKCEETSVQGIINKVATSLSTFITGSGTLSSTSVFTCSFQDLLFKIPGEVFFLEWTDQLLRRSKRLSSLSSSTQTLPSRTKRSPIPLDEYSFEQDFLDFLEFDMSFLALNGRVKHLSKFISIPFGSCYIMVPLDKTSPEDAYVFVEDEHDHCARIVARIEIKSGSIKYLSNPDTYRTKFSKDSELIRLNTRFEPLDVVDILILCPYSEDFDISRLPPSCLADVVIILPKKEIETTKASWVADMDPSDFHTRVLLTVDAGLRCSEVTKETKSQLEELQKNLKDATAPDFVGAFEVLTAASTSTFSIQPLPTYQKVVDDMEKK